MDSMLEAARQEHAELTKQLEVISKRVAELDTFLRVAATIHVDTFSTEPASASQEPKPPTFKAQVIMVTQELLTGSKWMKTRNIIDHLADRGITINSENKIARISSILVKEKDTFVSNRRKGWSLRSEKIAFPKGKGLNARTFSPLGATQSRSGRPSVGTATA